MKRTIGILAALALAMAAAMAADQATLDRGKRVEQTTCVPCHGTRLIDAQRLSRAAWDREINKMTGWGWTANAPDRAALLEFLVANSGDDKPAPPPEMSRDGRK